VQGYLDALVEACTRGGTPPVSVAVFGSAAKGSFSDAASDVDLILVLADGATAEERRRAHDRVAEVEVAHGLRAPLMRTKGPLEAFIDRAGGNALSCFVCTRADLLSGDAGRVFGLKPAEAVFVDRIVLANIVASAVTVYGEDLLPSVPVPPIRRLDVFKALFGFVNQAMFVAAAYPVLPYATKHAMGALKRSLHSCYFAYHLRPESLDGEVRFFNEMLGNPRAIQELMSLRGRYHESYGFVLRLLPTLLRLHLRTAADNRFPRAAPSRTSIAR
jgi:predicted nucleotidyltransferase